MITVPVMLVTVRASTNVITALWQLITHKQLTALSCLFSSQWTTDSLTVWHSSWQLLVAFSPQWSGGGVVTQLPRWEGLRYWGGVHTVSRERGQTAVRGGHREQMPLCMFWVTYTDISTLLESNSIIFKNSFICQFLSSTFFVVLLFVIAHTGFY